MKRLAENTDFENVFCIYMHESVVQYLGYDLMGRDQFKDVFEELVSSRSFYVFEHNNEIAGFYKSARYPGRAQHVAYIGTLAVSPKYQGVGIAKTMMEDEISGLTSHGVKRIEIIVEVDNIKAIRFYKKLGFEIEGTLKKFYKRSHESFYIDDHIMGLVF